MGSLDKDIAVFDKMREKLEAANMGQWALIHNQKLIGTFDSFDGAAQEAVRQFGKGPYLIREIGATKPTLPASVLYQPINA